MLRREFLKAMPAVVFLQRGGTIKPEISEKRGFADFDLDGNGGWAVRGHTIVLEKAGVPEGKIRRPAALAIL